MVRSASHRFDGGAATFIGTLLLGLAVTLFTFGICFPFALVLQQRWKAKHTTIDGRRLVFTGSAVGLFGNWIKWWLLTVVTIGIYGLWVVPRVTRWVVEHTDFDPEQTHAFAVARTHGRVPPVFDTGGMAALGPSEPTPPAIPAGPTVETIETT